jgi:hypothetical protein
MSKGSLRYFCSMDVSTLKTVCSSEWQKGGASILAASLQIKTTIQKALETNTGAIIGRHGTIEFNVLLNPTDKDQWFILETNAGVFPRTLESVSEWVNDYKAATAAADVMAVGWHEPIAEAELAYVQRVNPKAYLCPLRSLEAYYVSTTNSWLRALDDQKVAVVSSFADTMFKQVVWLPEIWAGREDMLPRNVSWSFIRSYYSPALARGSCDWPHPVYSWKDAVEYMELEVLATGARVCLIGCGGLAMPLALRLKKKGIVCIVLGGAIQLLFGIKGRRWEKHGELSKLFNCEWTVPALHEIPHGANQVEGGCYW